MATYYATSTGTDATWTTWTGTGTSATSAGNQIWVTWNTASGTSTATTTAITVTDCWITWIDQYGTQHRQQVAGSGYTRAYAPAPETPEQAEARRRREEEAAAARAEREAERRETEARAEALLVSLLDDEQRAELAAAGQFHVVGSQSGKRYCIKRGYAGNVVLVEEDGRRRKYCAHGRDALPTADHMVMQKLCIEAAEDRFLAVANVS